MRSSCALSRKMEAGTIFGSCRPGVNAYIVQSGFQGFQFVGWVQALLCEGHISVDGKSRAVAKLREGGQLVPKSPLELLPKRLDKRLVCV